MGIFGKRKDAPTMSGAQKEEINKNINAIQKSLENRIEKQNLDTLFNSDASGNVAKQVKEIKNESNMDQIGIANKEAGKQAEEVKKTSEFSISEDGKIVPKIQPANNAPIRMQGLNEKLTAKDIFAAARAGMGEGLPKLPETPALTPVDSYDYYEAAKQKLVENFNQVEQFNSALSIDDILVQMHLFLFDKKFIDPDNLRGPVERFIKKIFDFMHLGRAVVLSDSLIFDTVSYKDKILPILISNSKLLLQSNLVAWKSLIDEPNSEKIETIEAFILILENALNAGFEVKLIEDVVILRIFDDKRNKITSMFASEKFLAIFSAKEKLEQGRAQATAEIERVIADEKVSKEALSRIHHILSIDSDSENITLDQKKYETLKAEAEAKQAEIRKREEQERNVKTVDPSAKIAEVRKTMEMARPVQPASSPINVKPAVPVSKPNPTSTMSKPIAATPIKPASPVIGTAPKPAPAPTSTLVRPTPISGIKPIAPTPIKPAIPTPVKPTSTDPKKK